jgi:hypothetical protein
VWKKVLRRLLTPHFDFHERSFAGMRKNTIPRTNVIPR